MSLTYIKNNWSYLMKNFMKGVFTTAPPCFIFTIIPLADFGSLNPFGIAFTIFAIAFIISIISIIIKVIKLLRKKLTDYYSFIRPILVVIIFPISLTSHNNLLTKEIENFTKYAEQIQNNCQKYDDCSKNLPEEPKRRTIASVEVNIQKNSFNMKMYYSEKKAFFEGGVKTKLTRNEQYAWRIRELPKNTRIRK